MLSRLIKETRVVWKDEGQKRVETREDSNLPVWEEERTKLISRVIEETYSDHVIKISVRVTSDGTTMVRIDHSDKRVCASLRVEAHGGDNSDSSIIGTGPKELIRKLAERMKDL